MRALGLVMGGILLPVAAMPADKVSGTNYLLADTQSWPTGETTGYWINSSKGVRVSDDPDEVWVNWTIAPVSTS